MPKPGHALKQLKNKHEHMGPHTYTPRSQARCIRQRCGHFSTQTRHVLCGHHGGGTQVRGLLLRRTCPLISRTVGCLRCGNPAQNKNNEDTQAHKAMMHTWVLQHVVQFIRDSLHH